MKLHSVEIDEGCKIEIGEMVHVDGSEVKGTYKVLDISTVDMGSSAGDIEVLVELGNGNEEWLQMWELEW